MKSPSAPAQPAPVHPNVAPAMTRPRRPLFVPLVVGLAILVVSAAVVAVVMINRPGSRTGVDACLVGAWQVTDYSEEVSVASIGAVKFHGAGDGARLRLGQDGQGVVDYGAGTRFTSSVPVAGQPVGVDLVLAGTVRYAFRTNANVMSFSNVRADGTTTITTTTGRRQAEALKGSTDPAQYTCSGNVLTTYTGVYRAQLRRV
jgi:hypothetical protein